MTELHSRRPLTSAAATPLLAEDLDQLVAALEELNANLADQHVAALARRVTNLAAGARVLTAPT